jgi:flagella basal body P-ring formation protein FlgA
VPGKIMEKGYMGQLVQVQNTMSRKNIYAKVIDAATVMVDF